MNTDIERQRLERAYSERPPLLLITNIFIFTTLGAYIATNGVRTIPNQSNNLSGNSMHANFSFETLIANAQNALSEISQHPEYQQLVESDLWDDAAIILSDAKQAIDDLEKIHSQCFDKKYCQFTQSHALINLGLLESFNGR